MTKDGTMKRAEDYLDVNSKELGVTYTTLSGESKTARTSRDYYELAKNYAQKLINERPRNLGDFGKIFRDQCELQKNPEILYEVAFGTGASNSRGDVGWCIGVGVYGGTKGTTTIQVGLTPTYYYSFNAKDNRRDVSCTRIAYRMIIYRLLRVLQISNPENGIVCGPIRQKALQNQQVLTGL